MDQDNTEINEQDSCNLCGGCCEKRGPIIYFDDEHFIEMGKIPLKNIYTVREGEPFFDSKTATVQFTKTDIIRIKTKERSDINVCLFLNEDNKCEIFQSRPSECRAFKCWDTRQYDMVSNSDDYLTREHILSKVEGLWDFVKEHQEKCSYSRVSEATEVLKGLIDREKTEEQQNAIDTLNEIYLFDKHVREIIKEKVNIDPEIIEFLFGKELGEILYYFNLEVKEKDGKYYFSQIKI
ncbi:MAG: YkgJ family cysteine cluster protein [Deltaproteobacteria bacterium]|nr:YkgJ family cysteine cluster protein [Deltaproteobacteria bacterium]